MATPVAVDAANTAPATKATKQAIDPWNVRGEVGEDGAVKAIDYNKLTDEFGTKPIDEALLKRLEKVTGRKPHRFLRRGIVFTHRDLDVILDRYERGEPFFLYTGRGPSSDSMHIGHGIPFDFTHWLHETFDVPLVIMLTDDEKYMFSERHTIDEVQGFCAANARDIIAAGFDPAKTFIFSDFEFMGGAFYKNVVRFAKKTTFNQVKATFGFDDSSNIGRIHFGAIQGATSWASTFPHIFGTDEAETTQIPCLIPCAIDQDPYFRLTRDVSARLHFAKPSLIHAKFLDALQGPGTKMSASKDESAIFMKDSPKQIKDKINKYAFSGGRETVEEHREKGGDTDVDVSYQYLRFFLEDDDKLEQIRKDYSSGKMLTGEIKAKAIEELQRYVAAFQARRAAVTEEDIRQFMTPRPLTWRGNPRVPQVRKEAAVVVPVPRNAPIGGGEGEEGDGKMSKNQLKKMEKQKQIDAKKAAKAKEKELAAETA